jgi:large subunit ribosomal protein L30e
MPRIKTKKRKSTAVKVSVEKEIKDALKEKRVVIGSRTVFKSLKRGALARVVCSTNCPAESRTELEKTAKASSIDVQAFEGDSEKLGELCSRPFRILMIGIKK